VPSGPFRSASERRSSLRYYGDLTEAQTADVVGCGVGSVKAYTSRGLAALGAQLKETLA
jgi:DNA-directed RNA polymerase specialized sigma24 family protein